LWGFTDFNDLASEEPRLVARQVEEVLQGLMEKSQAPTQGIELAGAGLEPMGNEGATRADKHPPTRSHIKWHS
jgi:hypothetical protein